MLFSAFQTLAPSTSASGRLTQDDAQEATSSRDVVSATRARSFAITALRDGNCSAFAFKASSFVEEVMHFRTTGLWTHRADHVVLVESLDPGPASTRSRVPFTYHASADHFAWAARCGHLPVVPNPPVLKL